ncbi:MAG TPA: hypothetical protein GX747_03465 [Tenericutes bacterium]|nr:hypothetical protein [Mycoplasmatota bacterium]
MPKIEVKDLGFPVSIKQRVEKYLPTKSLDITYIKGQLISFKGTNIDVINPYKILVKKYRKELMLSVMGIIMKMKLQYFYIQLRIRLSGNQ